MTALPPSPADYQFDLPLDDRRFEDLFNELKLRIPQFAPEWTDHNESDPGIAMLQLFAWLGETMLYRFNRIPEKNYLKFLAMVGLTLHPPEAASVELTFTPRGGDTLDPRPVAVPKGTQVTAEAADGGAPVVFVTQDDVTAVSAKLAAVQTFDGATFTAVPDDGLPVPAAAFPAFGPYPQANAALYLGFDSPFPPNEVIALKVFLDSFQALGNAPALSAPPGACFVGPYSPPPPASVVWEYYAGRDPLPTLRPRWKKLDVRRDATVALSQSGPVSFASPPAGDAKADRLGATPPDAKALYWVRARIATLVGDGYATPPKIAAVLLNTVTATNRIDEGKEVLGVATGRPNQEYTLANVPVFPDTVVVEVDEGQGFEPWLRVADFAAADRLAKVFVVDPGTGVARFGDGEYGKIPLPKPRPADESGFEASSSVPNVRASYGWGGGDRGNVKAGSATALLTSAPFIESVTNYLPAEGGSDAETVAMARRRAPDAIRSRDRAVTAADFEYLAARTPAARVGRAKALPGYHPDFVPQRVGPDGQPRRVPVPGAVTVLVIPDAPETVRNPVPTQAALDSVAAWLTTRCPVATELFVRGPRYRKVVVEVAVVPERTASGEVVRKAVSDDLAAYLHPLHGGDDGTGWGFGRPVYFWDVTQRILRVPGVDRLTDGGVQLRVDGDRIEAGRDILLDADEVVYSPAQHLVQVAVSG